MASVQTWVEADPFLMSTSDAPLVQLVVGGDPDPWRAIGLPVVDTVDGSILLTSNCPVIWPGGDVPPGSVMLAVDPAFDSTLDGIAMASVIESIQPVASPLSVDHLVLNTDDLDRTCAEVGRVTGFELKRIRDAGGFRQGFHRLGRGGLIIEVVDRPGVLEPQWWGFVITVDDLDAFVDSAGGLVGTPREAVQPGRWIATVSRDAGLGTPVAFMSR